MTAARPHRAVVGAGAWGTTLAMLLAVNGPVTLLARDEAQAERLREDGTNERRLPGVRLDPAVVVTADPSDLDGAIELVVVALPAAALRDPAARGRSRHPARDPRPLGHQGARGRIAAADEPGRRGGAARLRGSRGSPLGTQPGS